MGINRNLIIQNYNKAVINHEMNNFKKTKGFDEVKDDEKLKKIADEFVSILVKQMLKSMRNTVPEGELVNGGFAEDIFTDMLNDEYSKISIGRTGFNSLGRILYEQLKQES